MPSQGHRNQAETGSEYSDELIRLMMDNAKDFAVILLDPDGRIVNWNAAAERLNGYRGDEIIGQPIGCLYSTEERNQGKPERDLEKATTEGRLEVEGVRVRKNGSHFWANVVLTALRDEAGHLRGFANLTRDITERKHWEETVAKQAKELLELSTPAVQIWDGVIVVPLVGSLDTERAQRLTEHLLQRIAETASPVAIVDITGVPTIDTKTAQHLIETITAVRLLGGQFILTGIRPTIAQTLVHLGIDLANVTTRPSLSAGLRLALEALNLEVVRKPDHHPVEGRGNL